MAQARCSRWWVSLRFTCDTASDMPCFSTHLWHSVQCSVASEDFIHHYQFLIDPHMVFHLIINVEELIQGIEQHFWSVALTQNVLILQGVVLHGGHLKTCDALGLTLPVLLHSVRECPSKSPLEYGFEPTGNNQ